MRQELTLDVYYGRMDTPEQAAGVKRLYKQLEEIKRDWSNFSPAPEFKVIQDRFGQVHIKLNNRMLMHLLYKFSELEPYELETVTPEEPPEWFMKLMGGEDVTRPDDAGI